MRVEGVVEVLESIAPPECAESWDNVGLLIGAASWEVERVMLTIDLTDAVLEEAIADGSRMVVAYHRPSSSRSAR